MRDGGQTGRAVLLRVRETLAALSSTDADLAAIGAQLAAGVQALDESIGHLVSIGKGDARAVYAGSVPYLMLCGTVLAGWQMARAAQCAREQLDAGQGDADFLKAKIATARFYADHILSRAAGLRSAVVQGAAGTLALEEAMF